MRANVKNRRGFTLAEMVVVIMIIAILAAIATPRLLNTSHSAADNSARQSLNVIRGAIEAYAVSHNGELPGADGNEATFKADLTEHLRGRQFPVCPVGEARSSSVRMLAGAGSITDGIPATAATHSWVYKYETGDFHINSQALSADGQTTYDQF
jgi:prepilin-type N-terminal cleavage/methylation domain-containing protein